MVLTFAIRESNRLLLLWGDMVRTQTENKEIRNEFGTINSGLKLGVQLRVGLHCYCLLPLTARRFDVVCCSFFNCKSNLESILSVSIY